MCKALEDFEKNAAKKGAWEKIVSIVSIKLRKGKSPEQIADELEESLPVIEKATAGTEKDARPGIFFCTHPVQADMRRQNRQ